MEVRRTAPEISDVIASELSRGDYDPRRGTRLAEGYIPVLTPIIPELERFDWRQECRWKAKRRCA